MGVGRLVKPLPIGDFQGLCLFTRGYLVHNNPALILVSRFSKSPKIGLPSGKHTKKLMEKITMFNG